MSSCLTLFITLSCSVFISGKNRYLMFVISIQARDGGLRTTIYKRDPSKQYGLKMKTSRTFFSEVERRFDAMPFTLRYEHHHTLHVAI